MFKRSKEHTACLVHLTKDETYYRTFNPPEKYVKGKIRNVEAFWGRMTDDDFYVNVWRRISTSRFEDEECGTMVLSQAELKNVEVQCGNFLFDGDSLWIWAWEEERIGRGIVPRFHIEVERRKLTDDDISKLNEIRLEFRQEMIDDVEKRLAEELSPEVREQLLEHKRELEIHESS